MRGKLLSLAVLLSLCVAVLAPVSSAPAAQAAVSASPAASHNAGLYTKAKFVLHIGFAYWAFHHFVWIPFKAGQLGANYKGNTVKAGLALLYAYHELKHAYGDMQKDSDLAKLKSTLGEPMSALTTTFSALGDKLHGTPAQPPSTDPADISLIPDLNTLLGRFDTAAKSDGLNIHEAKPPVSSGLFS